MTTAMAEARARWTRVGSIPTAMTGRVAASCPGRARWARGASIPTAMTGRAEAGCPVAGQPGPHPVHALDALDGHHRPCRGRNMTTRTSAPRAPTGAAGLGPLGSPGCPPPLPVVAAASPSSPASSPSVSSRAPRPPPAVGSGSSSSTGTTTDGSTPSTVVNTSSLDDVTVSTDLATKPTVTFDPSYAGDGDAVKVVVPGTGPAVAEGQLVTFDFVSISGVDGSETQTNWGSTQASPSVLLSSNQILPVVSQALVGQPVGSRVLAATDQAGQTSGVWTLFVFDIKSAVTPLDGPQGTPVTPADGLPTVTVTDGKPTISMPSGTAPTSLVVQPLIKGDGAVRAGRPDRRGELRRRQVRRRQRVRQLVRSGVGRRLPDRRQPGDPRLGRGHRRPDGRLAPAARDPARQGLRHHRQQQRRHLGHRHARVRGRHPRRRLTLSR